MKQPYRVVIFDWEGTLGDTVGAVLCAIARATEVCHFREFDESLARRSLGLGLPLLLKKLFPELSCYEQSQLLEQVQYELSISKMAVYLVPGARELLEALAQAGCKLAIATNKRDTALQRDLTATQLNDLIQVTRSADQTEPKPSPQMLEEILMHFNVTASEVVMIGDSETDMQMARAIGVDAIGIDTTSQHAQSLSLAGAQAVFSNYADLMKFLLNKEEKDS